MVFIGVVFTRKSCGGKLNACLTDSWPSAICSELVDEKDCFPVWLAKAGVQEVA
jgi:hypothetical protein